MVFSKAFSEAHEEGPRAFCSLYTMCEMVSLLVVVVVAKGRSSQRGELSREKRFPNGPYLCQSLRSSVLKQKAKERLRNTEILNCSVYNTEEVFKFSKSLNLTKRVHHHHLR